jgi:hypothetical protein
METNGGFFFAKSKIDFLLEFLELPHGIPSGDTINRVFSTIDSIKFEACFFGGKTKLGTAAF